MLSRSKADIEGGGKSCFAAEILSVAVVFLLEKIRLASPLGMRNQTQRRSTGSMN